MEIPIADQRTDPNLTKIRGQAPSYVYIDKIWILVRFAGYM